MPYSFEISTTHDGVDALYHLICLYGDETIFENFYKDAKEAFSTGQMFIAFCKEGITF